MRLNYVNCFCVDLSFVYKYLSIILLLFFFNACQLNSQHELTQVEASETIRQVVQQKYPDNLYLGATIGGAEWATPTESILNQQFSYITPDHHFKQPYIHPEPGKWRWKNADAWIEKAKKNKQVMRLHAPISPQASKWAREDHRTKQEMAVMLEEYLVALTTRYNGVEQVKWLDVVNEAITEEGDWFGPKPGTDAWENPWTILGFKTDIPNKFPLLKQKGVPLYIIKAFELAQIHAPDISLVLNQHRMTSPESIALMKELVLYLRELGLRVDGIGWQAHIKSELRGFMDPNSQYLINLDQLVKWAHANQFEFHITENNIHYPTDKAYDPNISKVYVNLLSVLLNNRDSGVVTWNLWNINDRPHYNNPSKQVLGLWDENFKPQPAYFEFLNTLKTAK